MDGQANDFTIDEHGNLVPVAPEVEDGADYTDSQALIVLSHKASGAVTMEIFGAPTPALMQVLQAVIKAVTTEFPEQ